MNETNYALASRGKRFGGALLDGIISLAAGIPLVFATGASDQIRQGQPISMGMTVILFTSSLGIFLLINGHLLAKHGQTVGKKIIGTRIVSNEEGQILSLGKVFGLRYFPISLINQIPLIGGIFGLTDALFIFRGDKRCIHDLIAGTVVIDIEQSALQNMEPSEEVTAEQ